jgi:hypothetical protein
MLSLIRIKLANVGSEISCFQAYIFYMQQKERFDDKDEKELSDGIK